MLRKKLEVYAFYVSNSYTEYIIIRQVYAVIN